MPTQTNEGFVLLIVLLYVVVLLNTILTIYSITLLKRHHATRMHVLQIIASSQDQISKAIGIIRGVLAPKTPDSLKEIVTHSLEAAENELGERKKEITDATTKAWE